MRSVSRAVFKEAKSTFEEIEQKRDLQLKAFFGENLPVSTYSLLGSFVPSLRPKIRTIEREYKQSLCDLLSYLSSPTSFPKKVETESKEMLVMEDLEFETEKLENRIINALLISPSVSELIVIIKFYFQRNDIENVSQIFKILIAELHRSVLHGSRFKHEDARQYSWSAIDGFRVKQGVPRPRHPLTKHETNLILQIERELRQAIKQSTKAKNHQLLLETHISLYEVLLYQVYDVDFFTAFWKNAVIEKGAYTKRFDLISHSYEKVKKENVIVLWHAMEAWLTDMIIVNDSLEKQKRIVDAFANFDFEKYSYFELIKGVLTKLIQEDEVYVSPELGLYCANHRKNYSSSGSHWVKVRKNVSLAFRHEGESASSPPKVKIFLHSAGYFRRYLDGRVSGESLLEIARRIKANRRWDLDKLSFGIEFFFEALYFIRNGTRDFRAHSLEQFLDLIEEGGREGYGTRDHFWCTDVINHLTWIMFCSEYVLVTASQERFLSCHPTIDLTKLIREILPVVKFWEKITQDLLDTAKSSTAEAKSSLPSGKYRLLQYWCPVFHAIQVSVEKIYSIILKEELKGFQEFVLHTAVCKKRTESKATSVHLGLFAHNTLFDDNVLGLVKEHLTGLPKKTA